MCVVVCVHFAYTTDIGSLISHISSLFSQYPYSYTDVQHWKSSASDLSKSVCVLSEQRDELKDTIDEMMSLGYSLEDEKKKKSKPSALLEMHAKNAASKKVEEKEGFVRSVSVVSDTSLDECERKVPFSAAA